MNVRNHSVAIPSCSIRIRNVFLALRIHNAEKSTRALLLVPSKTDPRKRTLPGGFCDAATDDVFVTLMRYVREQLCGNDTLVALEVFIAEALQHRTVKRLVGGGIFYAPYVTAQGFQSFDAYVVVDAPQQLIEGDCSCVTLFDARSSETLLENDWSKEFLLSLLRMRYQLRKKKIMAVQLASGGTTIASTCIPP